MSGHSAKKIGTAHIDGVELYYEVAGEGFPLVMAHAGFVDRRMWDEQIQAFAQYYQVIRYDRRGFGQSPLTPGPFSHRSDLHGLLRFLGIERVHLLGSSAGGAMMIDFALEHPSMVASLVLISSDLNGEQPQGEMPKPLQELVAALQAKDTARAAELAVQIWIDGPKRGPEEVNAHIRDRARDMSLTALPNMFIEEEALEPSAVGRLGTIHTPTLVMVGDQDDESVLATAQRLSQQIPGANEVVISGAAHLPNMERPEEFNRIVLNFLNQQDPA